MQAVRAPAVAGTFYPSARDELATMVDGLVAGGRPAPDEPMPKALVVPHAGYIYSGAVAGTAYARLVPFAERIKRVVLVGPSHRTNVRGVVTPGAEALATPLGDVRVDVEVLTHVPEVGEDARAHAREHSLEVQLPFLQRVMPAARIVPLAVGWGTAGNHVGHVLEVLWGGPETIIIVSSDLSHYLPYDVGRAEDKATAERILALDDHPIESDHACGAAGINGLLWVARRKHLRPALLDLRSSGDTAGTRDEVVGYAAFAFYEPETQHARVS